MADWFVGMIKKYLLLVCVIVGMHLQNIADGNAYEALCTNVATAFSNKRMLVSTAFTNQLSTCLGTKRFLPNRLKEVLEISEERYRECHLRVKSNERLQTEHVFSVLGEIFILDEFTASLAQ